MDREEKLTSPEPAATLWRRVCPVLEVLERYWPNTADMFTLGGGTVLAARWGHRRSQDIDIVAKRGTGVLRVLETDLARDFAELCDRAGAREISYLPFPSTLTVTFSEGDWDLSELDILLPGREAVAEVDGTRVRTLSNTQILGAKIVHRGFEGLPRDIFDLAVAVTLDAGAFEQAVGLCLPAEVALLAAETRAMANAYRVKAPDVIDLADTRWETTCRQAPEIVADALAAHGERFGRPRKEALPRVTPSRKDAGTDGPR